MDWGSQAAFDSSTSILAVALFRRYSTHALLSARTACKGGALLNIVALSRQTKTQMWFVGKKQENVFTGLVLSHLVNHTVFK